MRTLMMLLLMLCLYSCSPETKTEKLLRESKESVEDAAEDVKEKAEDVGEDVEEKVVDVKEGNDKEPTKKEKLKKLFKKKE